MASRSEAADALARARREKRNLSRRKSYDSTKQRQQGNEEVLAEARLRCEAICQATEVEAATILADARREAGLILEKSKSECARVTQRRDEIQSALAGHEARLLSAMKKHTDVSGEARLADLNEEENSRPIDIDLDAAVEFRRRDADRKRAAYARQKQLDSASSSQGRKPKRRLRNFDAAVDGDEELAESEHSNRARRSVYRMTSLLVSDALHRLNGFNSKAKASCLRKFWLHPAVKEYQPALFGNPRHDVSVAAAVTDLKNSLQVVKTAKRKDHLSAKQVLLTALSGECVVSSRYQTSLAKALGIQRQNLHKASRKRKLIDSDSSVKFPMGESKVRSDKVSDEVRAIVHKFWESNTRISPCKKDKVRLRLFKKVYEEHRTHWLEDTEVEFFLKFKDWCSREANGVQMGLRCFQYLKPYYIRTMKDRNVCCCKNHVEMDLLKEAINKFRRHEHAGDCTCNCSLCKSLDAPEQSRCVASKNLIGSVTSWTESVLCPKRAGKQWHAKRCLMGRCKKCGVEKNLAWCTSELDPEEYLFIDWQTFEYVELDEKTQQKRERKKGLAESATKKVTRQRMVNKRTSMLFFRNHVIHTMSDFIVHNFRAKWQAEQFRLCLKTFPRGTIVSSIDFSENYSFKFQNEIQSMHWDSKQITLLIHVVYRHREDSGEDVDTAVGHRVKMAVVDGNCTRDIIADYNFYVSDDNTHDTLFVQHCMDAHNLWLKTQGIQFDQHWVWSDGAASQFKACRPFYYVARYYRQFGARMKWFFHGSGHGKGVADALGGHIKQGLEKEQLKGLQGHRMENAHDAVEFCKNKFAMGQEKEYGDVQLVRRMFWEIPVGVVNRRKKWDCDTINGLRSLHCFDGFSPRLSTLLQVRELCCFCHHCTDDEPMQCENRRWTGNFKLQNVRGVLPSDVRAEVEEMGVGEGMSVREEVSLAECIQLGDFFAVRAEIGNKWKEEFYILQCDQPFHTVPKKFTDYIGHSFGEGDKAVRGIWYQGVSGREFKYVVIDDTVNKCYAHAMSIVHIRFGLTPCEVGKGDARMYTLHPDSLNAITELLGY